MLGAVTFLGGAGNDTFNLTALSLTLGGTLTVIGTGAATSGDTLRLTNVAAAKAIAVSLGDGASFVTIDNLRAGDTFTLATNGGADLILIERNNFVGNSTIAKLATILAGNGDDQVLIGNPLPAPNGGLADSTRVRFLAGLIANGGGDTDTFNDFGAQNDVAGPLTLLDFETPV